MISGYAKQVVLIQDLLKGRSVALGEKYWVRTVDSSQGREASVVILSLVRTNDSIWFWNQLNRVCVALSRHVDLLIILCSRQLYLDSNMTPWSKLQHSKDIQNYTSVDEATAPFLSNDSAADAKSVTPACVSDPALKKRQRGGSETFGFAYCIVCKHRKPLRS